MELLPGILLVHGGRAGHSVGGGFGGSCEATSGGVVAFYKFVNFGYIVLQCVRQFSKINTETHQFGGTDTLNHCISATPMRAPITGYTQPRQHDAVAWRLRTQGARRVLVPLDQIYALPEPVYGQRRGQLVLYARGRPAMGLVLVTKIACVSDKAIACARRQRARHRTVARRGR